MKIKDAVAQRIIDLCKEKNIAINALGNISGVNPSTIYSILNTKKSKSRRCNAAKNMRRLGNINTGFF